MDSGPTFDEASLRTEGSNAVRSALHTIAAYPPDLGDPIFTHYPAMKFGHRRSVRRFAERMAPVAAQWIAQSRYRDWVLTSPPLKGLPCGANLLCRAIHAILAAKLPDGVNLSLENLGEHVPHAPLGSAIEFERYNEYSKLDLETRQEIQSEDEDESQYDLDRFRDRCVIFVNDINVTGTQLDWIGNLLRPPLARKLHCLLILDVEPRVGRRFAHLESEINNSRYSRCDELISFLRDCEFDCTGKLIARLISYDAAELEHVLRALEPAKRTLIRRAILDEGLYGGALFAEKMRAVDRAAKQEWKLEPE